MKIVTSFPIIAILFILVASTSSVAKYEFCIVNVTPTELQPSEIAQLKIEIKNTGESAAYYVTTEIITEIIPENSPIKVIGETKKAKDNRWGYLGVNDHFTVTYKILVSSDAKPGVYYIPLKITWSDNIYNGNINETTLIFGLRVKNPSKGADISLIRLYQIPSELSPGNNCALILTLKNIGLSDAKNIKISIQPQNLFVPINSSFKFVEKLSSKETKGIRFYLGLKYASLDEIYYQIPVTIYYEDEFGSHIKNFSVGVYVKGKPDVLIQDLTMEPTKLTQKTEGTLVLTIINAGTEMAKDVRVKISGDIFTENYKFIGDLQPGQTQTIIFGVYVSGDTEPGMYSTNIKIIYKDKFGKEYEDSKIYTFKVYQPESFIPPEYIYASITLAVILFIAYVYFSKEVAKRRAKE